MVGEVTTVTRGVIWGHKWTRGRKVVATIALWRLQNRWMRKGMLSWMLKLHCCSLLLHASDRRDR